MKQTTSLVGPEFGNGEWKWNGCAQDSAGFIYAIPNTADEIMRFNPSTQETRLIPLDESVTSFKTWKWSTGMLANNDFLYFIPFTGEKQILAIPPMTFKKDANEIEQKIDLELNLVGDIYDSGWKWYDAVLGPDGFMYGLPANFNRILKFDPATQTSTLVGDDLGLEGPKFYGGLVGPDNMIYAIPAKTNKGILQYNPVTEETNLIEQGNILFADDNFSGGVLAPNGIIYLIPLNHNKVVKFDPVSMQLTEIGDNLGADINKWWGGVLADDGNIYCIPYWSSRVLMINLENDTTSLIGDEYPDNSKYRNGVLGSDGNVYASPAGASQILQINVMEQTTSLVGPDLGTEGWKWVKLVEGAEGVIYGIPAVSNDVLRFDPLTKDVQLIPLDESVTKFGRWKWTSGVLANDDVIYAVPFHQDQKQVLAIAEL